MPRLDELVAPLLAHPEQHLQLVLERPELNPSDPSERLIDQPLVVRRDTDVAAGLEQRIEAEEEVRPYHLVVGERNRGGLEVDALAEADARSQIRKCLDVVERAPQARLENNAEVAVPVLTK